MKALKIYPDQLLSMPEYIGDNLNMKMSFRYESGSCVCDAFNVTLD